MCSCFFDEFFLRGQLCRIELGYSISEGINGVNAMLLMLMVASWMISEQEKYVLIFGYFSHSRNSFVSSNSKTCLHWLRKLLGAIKCDALL